MQQEIRSSLQVVRLPQPSKTEKVEKREGHSLIEKRVKNLAEMAAKICPCNAVGWITVSHNQRFRDGPVELGLQSIFLFLSL